MKQKILLFCLLIWMMMGQAYAQSRQITGTVTSASDSKPLAGVSVLVSGTTLGTQTNQDGQFTITVPNSQAKLLFSYVGYQDQSAQVGS